MSLRRACTQIRISQGLYRHCTNQIQDLANRRIRYEYLRIRLLLRHESWKANGNGVYIVPRDLVYGS
ncbi:MAG: hypothetical protein NAOJABEB_01300 [Steroidobacteraceae bacterium]|nr:hypothetical protein [Steroidobacteraceae bacterium]